MATFEDREIIDYTMKKLEKVLEPENFMIKDLNRMHNRLKKQEESLKKIIGKIENLVDRIEILEKENSSSESSSD